MTRGHQGRVDENQLAIARALQAEGWSTQSLASVGLGCPDLVCGAGRINVLLECKNPNLPPSEKRLTAHEAAWHQRWRGQVAVVETPEEALKVVKEELLR